MKKSAKEIVESSDALLNVYTFMSKLLNSNDVSERILDVVIEGIYQMGCNKGYEEAVADVINEDFKHCDNEILDEDNNF